MLSMVSYLVIYKLFWMLLLFMDKFFTHLVFLLLPRNSRRETSHELYVFWNLVVGNLVLTKVIDIVIQNIGTVIELD